MKQFKPLIITTLMITLLLSSYAAFASEYGSKDDPLVSLSYIKEILLPQALSSVDDLVEERTQSFISEFEDKMGSFQNEFSDVATNSEFIEQVAQAVISSKNSSDLVTLTSGQTLTFASGTEFMLRSGSASVPESNGIVNSTTGSLANSSISINNLYLSCETAQTLTALESCTVLVLGSYTKN